MDKYTVQMMHDNKWMAEKVKFWSLQSKKKIFSEKFEICKIKVYVEESKKLNEEASKLEKENIESMTKLFECSVSDLKVIKYI